MMEKRIAVIGAGLSGLLLAQSLKSRAQVVVYEKARGVGGRMSTRYADPYAFDHGAQCFTARTPAFQEFLKPFIDQSVVAEWRGRVVNLEAGLPETDRLWREPHLVASPNMNSLCKALAEGLDIRRTVEIAPLSQKHDGRWLLHDKDGGLLGEYDLVISTAPPVQTINLFKEALPAAAPLREARLQGCYALMIGFNKRWDGSWIAARVRDNPLKWISINSTKPGRDSTVTSIVAHSRNDWAEEHIDDDVGAAQAYLLQQFEAVTGLSTAEAAYISTHRWRYAIVAETQGAGFYLDLEQGLAATSDWAATSRIEEVFINAQGLANELAAHL